MLLIAWLGCAAPTAPGEDTGAPVAPSLDDEARTPVARHSSGVASWPASSRSTQIGGGLPALYEPSGVTWHAGLGQLLLVSDEGVVSRMNLDGTGVVNWTFSGDYEAITLVDATSDLAYVGVERPDSIVEVDLSTGTLTGRSWNLETWMASVDVNLGLEALTFVPDGDHPYANGTSGGLFYAGLQATGDVYVFDVDLSTSNAVTLVDTLPMGRTDISDLFYDAETQRIYALFDTDNVLREMTTAGVKLAEYKLPGTEQEGVALVPGCPKSSTTIVIAEDYAASVKTYARYPISCVN